MAWMLGYKQIQLTDKPILDHFLNNITNQNSETTFTNLYMWRKSYAVRWAVVNNHLVIEPNAFEASWILPPYGLEQDSHLFKHAVEDVINDYRSRQKTLVVRAITESEKKKFDISFPNMFDYTLEPDIADYIYLGENLRTLAGRKYSKKRNHINAFKSDHPDYKFEEMTEATAYEALDFLERWYGKRYLEDSLDDGLLAEREAVYNALTNSKDLDFKGGFIRVGGKIVAFTMGEKVNEDTVVIHIEKAFPEYRGLYPVINQDYLNYFWQDITYVNREEDMGLPGLKKAKESYYPDYLLRKYRGVYING
jgi:hypothetical protein